MNHRLCFTTIIPNLSWKHPSKETTIESTQKAAQSKMIKEAAEKKRLEEEERLRQEKREANGKKGFKN